MYLNLYKVIEEVMSMRKLFVLAAGVGLWAATAVASGDPRPAALANETSVAMWIWADKYVYQPGESMVVRYTVRPYGDAYPYTWIAYRQNNQTGKIYYLPEGSETPTDIFGNPLGSFRPKQAEAVEKGVLIGPGGLFGPEKGAIPDEPGMHTIVLQLRDSLGHRVLKTAYFKIGVVTGFEDLTGNIESDRRLVNTKAYRLQGVVYVRNGATLTIEPGTFIFGMPGSQPPSVLVVTRNGRIVANGTRSRPIVMTSSQPIGQRQRGDWGGLILLGRVPINVGTNAIPGRENPAGEFYIEGLPASEDTKYGGNDPQHDCGVLRYVRVEFAGSIFAPNNEANSFTWGGCGSKTVSEYLQAIYGLDDSFEWFGGNNNAKYLIGSFGADDYVDFQLGYTGKIQHGIFYYNADARGNRGIEGDNSEYNQAAEPRSNPTMYNLTFIGGGVPGFDEANSPGIYLRRGSAGTFRNIVVMNFYSPGLELADASTREQADQGKIQISGLLLWNNNLGAKGAATLEGQVASNTQSYARDKFDRILIADPFLKQPFEWSDPDFRAMFASPIFRTGWVRPPDDGFFDQHVYWLGGVGDEPWWKEWTNLLYENDIKP
jgi:hypothetical protein